MAAQMAMYAPSHGKTGSSGSIPPYPQPPSPTLTNPDMILPDHLPDSPDRSRSPLMMWNNGGFDLGVSAYNMNVAHAPTTPIIYGNGTMLSDIGEVTEAESTVGGPVKSPRNGYYKAGFGVRQSSNNPAYEAAKKKKTKKSEPKVMSRDRERRLSMESTSTITNGDNPGTFADFDDSVSVVDSNFQGDDEESVADSYVFYDGADERTPEEEAAREAEERYSTALSRRAEQILANAKRRLTNMEGNLNRARSSLSVDSGGSEASPTPYSRPGTALQRHHDSGPPRGFIGHSRISSENGLLNTNDFKPATLSPRSSSALGVTGSYQQLLRSSSFRSAESKRDSPPNENHVNSVYGNAAYTKSKVSMHDSKYTLEQLGEDDASRPAVPTQDSLEDAKLDTFLNPTFGSYDDKGLRRSASTAQMRDIKDHMAELKGRLSSLRDQARADSMKRRSVQSLRSASPFTHARELSSDSKIELPSGKSMKDINKWNDGVESLHESDIGDDEDQEINDNMSIISDSIYSEQEAMSPRTGWNQDTETRFAEAITTDYPAMANGGAALDDDLEDMRTEDGYDDIEDDETDFQDVMSEGGESLYHDTVQHQVSHEDREDAFDYEHFFLHSAMGSMTQRKLTRSRSRGSRASFSSEDSVETTRGPTINGEYQRGRRGSNASLSSVDSFLTATEGRITRAENNEGMEYFPAQGTTAPKRTRSHTPNKSKRITLDLGRPTSHTDLSQPRATLIQRPQSSAATYMHRPSVSSLGSAGTNRSFPLVNRPKPNGVLTPCESPDQGLKKISETLMSETASLCDSINLGEKPIGQLEKEDQMLVERMVASLGKCVLGLSENGRAGSESRVFRRRIEAARQILEGIQPV
ncbi:hypothetical protein PFICI_00228 [Pestalotiopsis fici W106-1]|uniref:Uncharacterized protein n=1 Tax=Pestalotiopsis fici (strain W106-1 / CGMCC3.15140) TaxID=1229662 RepID=W3XK74_PESFW|nr:uncharacterized protein PFICI_00228 [Pestalotiopsis fici W106-1]ETS86400.1 hypothetical protein PFICI_00228 [Pestalotiopsis fici W106-1]